MARIAKVKCKAKLSKLVVFLNKKDAVKVSVADRCHGEIH